MPSMGKMLRRGADGPFSQQELPAIQPLLTPVVVSGILLFVALVFIPIGVVLLDRSDASHYQNMRYDNIAACQVKYGENYTVLPKYCTFNITTENDMKAPIYFYYELRNFYQNGRRYLSSKSDTQLRNSGTKNNVYCKPFMQKYKDKLLYPCGLIARSFFTDRFNLAINGQELCNSTTRCIYYGQNNVSMWQENWDKWNEEPNWAINGIAWESDVKDKFNPMTFDNTSMTRVGWWQEQLGLRLPDVENEDFVVWMRVAALSKSFRKLHRIIRNKDLRKGDQVTITAVTWYPVDRFDGEKWIGIGTTTWAGMENYSLAWALLGMAIVCISLALIFGVMLLFGTRKLAEVNRFKWHNRPTSTALASIAYN